MLLQRIEVFLARNRMAVTTFGRLATHDPRFVLDLRMGRQPKPETAKKVEHFMNAYGVRNHAA